MMRACSVCISREPRETIRNANDECNATQCVRNKCEIHTQNDRQQRNTCILDISFTLSIVISDISQLASAGTFCVMRNRYFSQSGADLFRSIQFVFFLLFFNIVLMTVAKTSFFINQLRTKLVLPPFLFSSFISISCDIN